MDTEHQAAHILANAVKSVKFDPVSTSAVTAFYKRKSQEKNFPGDWKEQRFSPGSPAHVM